MSIVPRRDVPAVPEEWVDAVNKAINDANHEDLCNCDGWPDSCRSYTPGLWDLGEASLHIAISVLAPILREKESTRGDHWKRVATEIERDRDRLAGLAVEPVTLSTSQAADMLGVSRLTMVRFLDEGRLSYTRPGKHRRVRLVDVLAFKQQTTHEAAP